LLHQEGDAPIAVDEDVLADLPPLETSRRELVARALEQRPEAKALRRLMRARGAAVDAAAGSRFPNLVVSGTAQYANPSSRVFPQTDAWRFSANVNVLLEWSLHDVIDGASVADEARALQRLTRDDLRMLADAVRREVSEAHVAYRSAHRALEAARAGVEAAREANRVRMLEFRAGGALVSDVIDASVDEVRADLDLVNAAIDARVAMARLEHAVGEDDPALGETVR
jgi:outer membrane protein TolC